MAVTVSGAGGYEGLQPTAGSAEQEGEDRGELRARGRRGELTNTNTNTNTNT